MKIDLTEVLRRVGNEADIKFEEKVSFPEDGLVLTQPVKVKAHLVNTGTSVLLSGTFETEVELECARCLEKFKAPLLTKIAEEYSKNPPKSTGKKGQEIELKEKDFVYPIEKDNALDLVETIRQNLLLALPIKALCKQECKGE